MSRSPTSLSPPNVLVGSGPRCCSNPAKARRGGAASCRRRLGGRSPSGSRRSASDEFQEMGRSQRESTLRSGDNNAMTEMTDRNRWIALYVLCAGVLMIVLDVTVVNVALPTIQDDLGFSQSSLAWVVNASLIPFGGLMPLAGRFGDILGRKRVFMAGLGIFTVASLLCSLANIQAVLV